MCMSNTYKTKLNYSCMGILILALVTLGLF